MLAQRILLGLVVLVFLCGIVALTGTDGVIAQDKKKEKDPLEGKKGTVIGTLSDKGTNFIEVKADGEEKGRKYVPNWTKEDRGPDKKMLKIISELKIGSRLEVEWLYEERFRVMGVKVLKAAEKDKK